MVFMQYAFPLKWMPNCLAVLNCGMENKGAVLAMWVNNGFLKANYPLFNRLKLHQMRHLSLINNKQIVT